MKFNRGLFVLLMLSVMFAGGASANQPRIEVSGLFKDRAVVVVEGKRYFIKKGQTVAGNVTLISSTTKEAVLEVNGEQMRMKMGGRIGGTFQTKSKDEVVIWKNPQGMFLTVGSINGFPVEFLVDTGATKVAMNRIEANRLGVRIDETLQKTMVSTASGAAPAFLTKLDRVRVGGITLRSVDAIILDGRHPRKVLLGMSFLNRVNFDQSGQSLTLTSK